MRNYHIPTSGSRSPLPFSESVVHASNKAIIRLIGLHIERLKQENGLSYETVGIRTGCAGSTVYNICKGKANFCGISLLSKLALSFGYTLEELLSCPVVPGNNSFGVIGR